MLGKTAGGLLWMARYLERSENVARLIETGLRIALTRSSGDEEWASIVATAAATDRYRARHAVFDSANVSDFMLRDADNPSSVVSALGLARSNARLVRTALTREVWEAINVCWMTVTAALSSRVDPAQLPMLLGMIRQQCAQVRGAMHGTMLRNDIYNFIRIGTFLERADTTARILDVKYYVLLPEVSLVGSSLDNVQWETILRAASAERAFGWLHGGESNPADIAAFLILDKRLPRSLAFCYQKLSDNLRWLEEPGRPSPTLALSTAVLARLRETTIQTVFDTGLHDFIGAFIRDNARLATGIEQEFRFHE